MNGAELGAECFVSAGNRLHAVVPTPLGLSGVFQSNAAPPHGCTSMPRCVLYQPPSAFGSLALKKMPPMPVTLFMQSPVVRAASLFCAERCNSIANGPNSSAVRAQRHTGFSIVTGKDCVSWQEREEMRRIAYQSRAGRSPR